MGLAVVSILVLLAVPSGREMLVKDRSLTNANNLITALNYARSEAVNRGQTITFCASTDFKACGNKWQDGQIIVDPSNHVLRIFPALPKEDNLLWNSSLNKNNRVEWVASGFTNGQRGSFYYCAGRSLSSNSAKIVLLNTGRIYLTQLSQTEYNQYCDPNFNST